MDPEWHHAAERVRRRTPLLLELGIATMVITPSEAVRRAGHRAVPARPAAGVAVPGRGAWFRPVEVAAAAPYFLFVGTLEPRKNLQA